MYSRTLAFLCAGNPSTTRCTGLLRPFIIFLSNSMNSSAFKRPLVGREPEATLGVDSRGRRDRLALAGALDDRGLALGRPGLAVHGVGPKSRLVPEVDVAPRFASQPRQCPG